MTRYRLLVAFRDEIRNYFYEVGSILFAFKGQSDETYEEPVTLVTSDAGGYGYALPVPTGHLEPYDEEEDKAAQSGTTFNELMDNSAAIVLPQADVEAGDTVGQQAFASGGGGDFAGGGASSSFEAPSDDAAKSAATTESSPSSSGSSSDQTSSNDSGTASSDSGSSGDSGSGGGGGE